MKFKEAIISLEEVKQYFLDMIVNLENDKVGMKSDKFGLLIFNAYCDIANACKHFQPVNDIIFSEDNE